MARTAEETKFVREQIIARGLKNTAANRKMLLDEYRAKYGQMTNVFQAFDTLFPNYAGMFSNRTALETMWGQDLVALLDDIIANPNNYDFDSQAGQRAWKNKLEATQWFKTRTDDQEKWDLKKPEDRDSEVKNLVTQLAVNYGQLGLTVSTLQQAAGELLRNGLTGQDEKWYMYRLAFNQKTGKSRSMASQTSEADALRSFARSYGYSDKNLDSTIESILTGTTINGVTMTEDQFKRAVQQYAKDRYPHLASRFEDGATLTSVFKPYRDVAAQILDRSEDSISPTDPLFERVLGAETGQLMSMYEFRKKLRTDAEFGYDKTATAKNDAVALANSIAAMFGKQYQNRPVGSYA